MERHIHVSEMAVHTWGAVCSPMVYLLHSTSVFQGLSALFIFLCISIFLSMGMQERVYHMPLVNYHSVPECSEFSLTFLVCYKEEEI